VDPTKQTRTALLRNAAVGKLQTIFGWILVALAAIMASAHALDPVTNSMSTSVGGTIIFAVPGVALLLLGYLRQKLNVNYKRYVGLISSQNMTSFQALANDTGQSIEKVIKDLDKMIGKNFFVGASLDMDRQEIVIFRNQSSNATSYPTGQAQPVYSQVPPAPFYQAPPVPAQPSMVTVKCAACGATNVKQTGTVAYCEYCGSPI